MKAASEDSNSIEWVLVRPYQPSTFIKMNHYAGLASFLGGKQLPGTDNRSVKGFRLLLLLADLNHEWDLVDGGEGNYFSPIGCFPCGWGNKLDGLLPKLLE